jgi:hypothetical protein
MADNKKTFQSGKRVKKYHLYFDLIPVCSNTSSPSSACSKEIDLTVKTPKNRRHRFLSRVRKKFRRKKEENEEEEEDNHNATATTAGKNGGASNNNK